MARLSQKQRNEIIARYLAGESISSLAKSYNVSYQAIAKQLKDDKVQESSKKLNTNEALSMIAYIEAKKGNTQKILDQLFEAINHKIMKASLRDCISSIKDLTSLYLEREQRKELEQEAQDLTVKISIEDTSGNEDNNTETV